MNINDLYDRIVLINLVERPDKLEHAKKQLEFANITNYDIYSAVKFDWSGAISMLMTLNKCGQFNYNTNPNEFSCALSHYNVIKKAYLEGVEKLFIFEDDICFHNDYNKYISSYLNNLPSDTNLLMLSGFICDDNVPPLEKIYRARHTGPRKSSGQNPLLRWTIFTITEFRTPNKALFTKPSNFLKHFLTIWRF